MDDARPGPDGAPNHGGRAGTCFDQPATALFTCVRGAWVTIAHFTLAAFTTGEGLIAPRNPAELLLLAVLLLSILPHVVDTPAGARMVWRTPTENRGKNRYRCVHGLVHAPIRSM